MLGVDAGESAELQKLVWSVAHGHAHLHIEAQMKGFDAAAANSPTDVYPPNLGRYLSKRG